jgi:hypothetical protein
MELDFEDVLPTIWQSMSKSKPSKSLALSVPTLIGIDGVNLDPLKSISAFENLVIVIEDGGTDLTPIQLTLETSFSCRDGNEIESFKLQHGAKSIAAFVSLVIVIEDRGTDLTPIQLELKTSISCGHGKEIESFELKHGANFKIY